MNVKAINSVSSLGFEGRTKKSEHKKTEHNYPQNNEVISKNGAKAMRAAILIPVAAAAGITGLTSCEPLIGTESFSHADAWAYCLGNPNKPIIIRDTTILHDTITKHDTIVNTEIKPIYLNGYPENISDSIIAQGVNIGVPVEGEGVYIGSKAHNRYDNKFYESQVDSTGTNNHQMAIVTKITDMYSQNNPKTSWQRSVVNDVPGRGIRIDRYVANTGSRKPEAYEYNYAGYEIRSNGKNGQKNTKYIFDSNNKLIWKGEYIKGEDVGTFLYGTVVTDKNGNPYLDENGKPEVAQYDFDKAKMWAAPLVSGSKNDTRSANPYLSQADENVHDINELVLDMLSGTRELDPAKLEDNDIV